MSEKKEKIVIQWQPLIEIIVVMMTILGSTIPLYIHTDTKMQTMHIEMRGFHKDILDEMKDFHGRLCAIEERKVK